MHEPPNDHLRFCALGPNAAHPFTAFSGLKRIQTNSFLYKYTGKSTKYL